jgi:hypothetical protein
MCRLFAIWADHYFLILSGEPPFFPPYGGYPMYARFTTPALKMSFIQVEGIRR